jgi:inner membrane protein
MASGTQHALIGSGLGVGCWMVYCKLSNRPLQFGEVLLAAGVGAVGGLIPDLLEPAIHPNHRQFFHSYVAAALLVQANKQLSTSAQIPAEARGTVHLVSLGFLSHLVIDAQTPKGLPWI